LAKPYETIYNYYPSPMYDGKMKEALKMLGNAVNDLPGVKVMNSVPKPTNFAQLFTAFVTYIHAPGNGCAWNGSAPGGSAVKMLDGDTKSSECATFANAFMMLAWAPPPYGLGLPKAQLSFESYSGRYKLGFVSTHPTIGVMKLLPNVANQQLYFWANHKVINYQNRYHDVMYNTSYAQKEDMALYHVMPNEITLSPPDVQQAETYHPVEPAQAPPQGKGAQGSFFKEAPAGRYAGPSTTMPF